MVLCAGVSFCAPELADALGLSTVMVPRGMAVGPEHWPLLANMVAMLSSGLLVWRPPTVAARRIAPPPPAAPRPVVVRDYVAELRVRLSLIVEQRGCDWATAEDVVIASREGASLFQSAVKQYADTPRTIELQGYSVRSGAGSHGSRSVAGFREHLQERTP
jgi:hypothetical protein